MKKSELLAVLNGLAGDPEVLVRWNDDKCSHVSGIVSATPEHGCTDTLALILDADTKEARDADLA